MNDAETQKTSNELIKALVVPFYIFFNILKYAKKGLKFVLFNPLNKKGRNIEESSLEKNSVNIRVQKESKWSKFYDNLWFNKKQRAKYEQMAQALALDLQNEGANRTKYPRVFQYIAKNNKGKIERGTINGYSKLDGIQFIISSPIKR